MVKTFLAIPGKGVFATSVSRGVSLTKKAENWGWAQKDIDTVNKLVGEGSNYSLSWTTSNSGKLCINLDGQRLGTIEPTTGLHGEDIWSVVGKVGSKLDIEQDYKTLPSAVAAIKKRISNRS